MCLSQIELERLSDAIRDYLALREGRGATLAELLREVPDLHLDTPAIREVRLAVARLVREGFLEARMMGDGNTLFSMRRERGAGEPSEEPA